MYNEFSSRKAEVKYLMEFEYYKNLKQDIKTVEMLLAISIFYKRVILNLESATKFSGNVYSKSTADSIRIGTYDLTPQESRRISAVVSNYKELISKYFIPSETISYTETKSFLRSVVKYKRYMEQADEEDKNTDNGKSV